MEDEEMPVEIRQATEEKFLAVVQAVTKVRTSKGRTKQSLHLN
jgi:hypothetical protein